MTLEQRLDAALRMLAPDRKWGLGTELARCYGVSRPLLYETRDRVRDALIEALLPRPAGRPAHTTTLTVDRELVDRAIITLPLLKGTVRDIRLGLHLLLGVSRSVGYISQTLAAAGEQAQAHNLSIRIPLPILGEADEIFQGRQPCITLVDGRSFLVVNLTPARSRDGDTWGLTYLELVERGIRFHDLASDGGAGLPAGVQEAQLAIPLRPETCFISCTTPIFSAANRKVGPTRPSTVPNAPGGPTWRREGASVGGAALSRSRRHCPRQRLKRSRPSLPATPGVGCWGKSARRCTLRTGAEAQATLETAIVLLKELGHRDITALADDLQGSYPSCLRLWSGWSNT